MKHPATRRRFLRNAVQAAGGLAILPSARTAFAYRGNEQLRLAVFGTMYNAAHFLYASHIYNADVVALCNTDQRKVPAIMKRWQEQAGRLAQSDQPDAAKHYERLAQGKGVRVFADIRQLFDDMADGLDALVVSDYDHFHGVTCGEAMRAGRPVCSERPIGLTINDARSLRALATEKGLPTTYRSPGTGMDAFRRAMELVEDGAIGQVHEVHIWFKRGGPDRSTLPQGPQPVPEGLHWDLWLGPLPWREYHPDWMVYAHWRETSNGGLGSFGPHTTIFPFMTLRLRKLWDTAGATIRVQAECSRQNSISFPHWERVRWEIPARQGMAPVTITWHHGPEYAPGTRKLVHEQMRRFGVEKPEEADALMRNAGSLLMGTEGALVADDHSVHVTALPKEKFAGVDTTQPQRIAASHGIYRDWIDACRGARPHILASFDNGGPLSELLMMGNIATQFPETTLCYDPIAGQITNHAEANAKRGYDYREGWQI